jgi:AAA domain
MTFELVCGPHDGITFEARADIKDRHLYDPKAVMGVLSFLSTIPRGKRPRHIFVLVYGTDGVGKSTLCSRAPNSIFVGAGKGTKQLDAARFSQTESIGDLLDQLQAVQTQRPWWKFWNN